jgi:branched-chain amino acid transport system substrate-binding protein
VLVTVAGVVVAACSSGTGAANTTTSSSSSTTSTTVKAEDHELVIGTVLPSGGSVPDLGVSLAAGVQLAVNEINAAGGVFGNPVRLVAQAEGDTAAAALLGVQSLLTAVDGGPVDAIVGPVSSTNVLATLAVPSRAGVLTCSPTASALSLDQFPDNGLFFRTVPSDSLQAAALARAVGASGTKSVGVVYLDDAYGRPLAKEVERDMQARSLAVRPTVAVTGNDASIAAAVKAITAAHPPVVVVIADAVTGPAAIRALDAAASTSVQYFVNDAMRHPDASVPPFEASLGKRVHGMSPLAYPMSDTFLDALHTVDPAAQGLYAVKAYDCVNLIALAAQASGYSSGPSLAASISSTSSDGSGCADFEHCNDVLRDGFNPDYNGPDGHLSIDTGGSPSDAMFEPFSFDANGRDVGAAPGSYP